MPRQFVVRTFFVDHCLGDDNVYLGLSFVFAVAGFSAVCNLHVTIGFGVVQIRYGGVCYCVRAARGKLRKRQREGASGYGKAAVLYGQVVPVDDSQGKPRKIHVIIDMLIQESVSDSHRPVSAVFAGDGN